MFSTGRAGVKGVVLSLPPPLPLSRFLPLPCSLSFSLSLSLSLPLSLSLSLSHGAGDENISDPRLSSHASTGPSAPSTAQTPLPNASPFANQPDPSFECRNLTSNTQVCRPPAETDKAVLAAPRSTGARCPPISAPGQQSQSPNPSLLSTGVPRSLETTPPLGPPYGPRHEPNVGS